MIPALSNLVYDDGEPIRPGQECVPYMLLRDSHGKIKFVRGPDISIQDVNAPKIEDVQFEQVPGTTKIRLVSGSVSDDSTDLLTAGVFVTEAG